MWCLSMSTSIAYLSNSEDLSYILEHSLKFMALDFETIITF